MAGQILLKPILAKDADAPRVDLPQKGAIESVNIVGQYANAINAHADILDDHSERIGSLEQIPQQFQGYGPITFAFSIGMSGEFEAYTVLAQKVGSS